jgi:hypothetical protein
MDCANAKSRDSSNMEGTPRGLTSRWWSRAEQWRTASPELSTLRIGSKIVRA